MSENSQFSAIRIRLASPEKILEWSHGEVTKAETINYRSLKPDIDGLFCQKIFGPMKDYECFCGKYKKQNYTSRPTAAHLVCSNCGVEITKSSVRREYMGHIHLAAPVVHLWYLRGDCYLKTLLEMDTNDLVKVIYYAAYVVIDPGSCVPRGEDSSDNGSHVVLNYKDVLEKNHWEAKEAKCLEEARRNPDFVMPKVSMGAEAIKILLQNIDLEKEKAQLEREAADPKNAAKNAKIIKRLDVINSFIESGNKPEWIVLENLPVIPPDLRPMVQLDGGRFATSDLNDLYRQVIQRNNRLKRATAENAPFVMLKHIMRALQDAVDALIDNDRRERTPTTGAGHRPLKSLTSMLKGKQGRFRQNLLGKRVDYSGRSVIVVGPELKMYQCGLPKEMALELFRPFVIKQLVASSADKDEKSRLNIKTAKNMIEKAQDPAIWEALEKVIRNHPVLLNRAPTLHRLGIQAFEPVLVEGRALKLHPLVCTAFNADFDGDQMPVHVPLSIEAQAEARFLMLASNNILKPQDGSPVVCPTQDMVLGCYYLSSVRANPNREEGHIPAFYCEDEAMYAYQMGEVTLQEPIKVAITRIIDGEPQEKVIDTTVGKLILNDPIPQDLGFVDRSAPGSEFELEINKKVGKKDLGQIIDRCYRIHGAAITSVMLDEIKALGFKYSTRAGITVGYKDIIVPSFKYDIVAEAEKKVAAVEEEYEMGNLSRENRKADIIAAWKEATDKIGDRVMDSFGEFNPVRMMADSGARGSKNQILQLVGMRGLMNDTAGGVIEVPVKSNFREGLSVLEFFVSSHGARKGLTDTALKTADSGYLTRRLVDVSQDVIVRQDDCFAEAGKPVTGSYLTRVTQVDDKGNVKEVVSLKKRINGRYTSQPVIHPQTGEILLDANQRITFEMADKIEKAGIEGVWCRTLLTCQCEHGVCRKCYGDNLATGNEVDIGEAVGIVAAQAIGEPGTQLTMRTFHTGGVASASDITTGLPRVEEIFEARKPKGAAILSKVDGVVTIEKTAQGEGFVTKVIVTPTADGSAEEFVDKLTKQKISKKDCTYGIPTTSKRIVENGDVIKAGDPLTEGTWQPAEVLEILGEQAVQNYLIEEVHKVYSSQGVELSNKHIEIIVRQMMRRVQVESAGDTNMLPGDIVEKYIANKANEEIMEINKKLLEDWKSAQIAMLTEQGVDFDEAAIQVENMIPDIEFKRPAILKPLVMGITKAALANGSFLAAASFQQTTSILTKAAIKGKTDHLLGLKENIIIGKLIPAGIGMKKYCSIDIDGAGIEEETQAVQAEYTAEATPAEYASEDFDDEDFDEEDFGAEDFAEETASTADTEDSIAE